MRVLVRLWTPAGELCELTTGAIIGRLRTASLVIDDPRVSEAHALVSLRGGVLQLLALRGRLTVAGEVRNEVTLHEGLLVELAPGLELEVHEVSVPAAIWGLRGDLVGDVPLGGVLSLLDGPKLQAIPRFVPDASAILWFTGSSYRLRNVGAVDRDIALGDAIIVGAHTVHVVALPSEALAPLPTLRVQDDAMRIVARYDTVHIFRNDSPALVLDGVAARLMCELASAGVPMSWRTVARELWREDEEDLALRRRLDSHLARLRKKLRDAGLRADLVRSNGQGHLELFLWPSDVVQDEM